ncbi:MAG: hypothetical protein HY741_15220 [Chloroflexi bacterium]|nr:hypothetical protein [Chloroflexota bacterium]
MDVEIFALCDAATDSAGKLNLLGAFDRINVAEFPYVHPFCAVAVRVRFERIEQGNHHFRLDFVDMDGKAVLPTFEGNLGVNFPEAVHSVCTNMILNLGGVKFERAGQYSIDLAIDSRHERSLPVNVVRIESAAAG